MSRTITVVMAMIHECHVKVTECFLVFCLPFSTCDKRCVLFIASGYDVYQLILKQKSLSLLFFCQFIQ